MSSSPLRVLPAGAAWSPNLSTAVPAAATPGTPAAPSSARHDWRRRLDLLIPPAIESKAFNASRLFAATYPEAVKLAALIGSLHWRRLAAGDPGPRRRFTAEVAWRRNAPDYRPRIANDPLAHWMDADC